MRRARFLHKVRRHMVYLNEQVLLAFWVVPNTQHS